MKVLSLILFVISVVYLAIPIDFDNGILGYVDDFMFFMSSFCFMYSQFVNTYYIQIKLLLKMLSVIFCFMGAVSLLLMVLFLK